MPSRFYAGMVTSLFMLLLKQEKSRYYHHWQTSRCANAYYKGHSVWTYELAFYAPCASPWSFVRFLVHHPKSLYVGPNGKLYIFHSFDCEFLWFVVLSHVLITNWANPTVFFQFPVQSLVRLRTVVIIIIRWRLPYGMSIVTKIIFIYNNRLTLWMVPRGHLSHIDKPFLYHELPIRQ